MNVTLITGDHPRHLYFADQLINTKSHINWIIQKRERFIPDSNDIINNNLRNLFQIHFKKREEAEFKFFGKQSGEVAKKKISNIYNIEKSDLGNGKLKNILLKINTELLLTYGCDILPDDVLEIPKIYKWNVHAGLSPWYKGSATHFWPTYLLEPEFTGLTLHELSNKIDGGNIIHQSAAKLNINDGIHENACRAVKEFSEKLPNLLKEKIFSNLKLIGIPQKTTGRIWTEKMWNPLTLKLIYELYEDKVNKFCIENKKLALPNLKSILNT